MTATATAGTVAWSVCPYIYVQCMSVTFVHGAPAKGVGQNAMSLNNWLV